MKLKLTKQEATELADSIMFGGGHWGPAVVQVMHRAYGFEDDAMVWAGTNFFGGIAGHQDGICGAVSAIGVTLAFRYRDNSGDEAKIREAKHKSTRRTSEIVRQFKEKFGTINCLTLAQLDFSDPGAVKKYFADPEKRAICPAYVRFVVEKLIELEG